MSQKENAKQSIDVGVTETDKSERKTGDDALESTQNLSSKKKGELTVCYLVFK